MFTGLIEKTAVVLSNTGNEAGYLLSLVSPWSDTVLGESIAVNGVCLTLVQNDNQVLLFQVSPETLSCTTLQNLAVGQVVNLERAVTGVTKLGGHWVLGHVDKTYPVKALLKKEEYLEVHLGPISTGDKPYLVTKGSITVEGVSLTINAVDDERLSLLIIPHTFSHTSLQNLEVGTIVNIEFDYFSKLIQHQLQHFIKTNQFFTQEIAQTIESKHQEIEDTAV